MEQSSYIDNQYVFSNLTEYELEHYGVLGMKWGVRRTPAQLARAAGRSLKKGYETSYKTRNIKLNEKKRKNYNTRADVQIGKNQKKIDKLERRNNKLNKNKKEINEYYDIRNSEISKMTARDITARRVGQIGSRVVATYLGVQLGKTIHR